MAMRMASDFLSKICADKWSSDQPYQTERAYADTEDRQDNDGDNKSDCASGIAGFAASEFFGADDGDDII